jgi:microcystin degradation protein MlrC
VAEAERLQPGGFPAYCRGAAMLERIRGQSLSAGGMIARVEAAGHRVAPLVWAFANPAAPVEDQAFEAILGEICAHLARAHLDEGGVDGVLLDLHGAMVTPRFPDAEGEIITRVRAIVGPEVPVVVSLDPHVNLTHAMVERADAVILFRTYPHIDMKTTGERAADLLFRRLAHGRPFARAFRQIDFLTPISSQCTMVEPMAGLMALRDKLAAQAGIAELSVGYGFPYADFADCGPALAAFGEDQRAVDAAIDALKREYDAREAAFAGGIMSAAEAVAEARRIAATADRPVVIADTQDNPGGGGHGDTTGLLAELIHQGAAGAAFALINDAESVAACHVAGEGASVRLSLGGKSVPPPLEVEARVLKLSDGSFVNGGPMTRGVRAELGRTALIEVAPGIEVVVTSRKMQAYDRMIFRHLGVEPERRKILALKSSVHFRADFQPIAAEVIVAAAPGPVVADPGTLPWKHLRPGLRTRPKANA